VACMPKTHIATASTNGALRSRPRAIPASAHLRALSPSPMSEYTRERRSCVSLCDREGREDLLSWSTRRRKESRAVESPPCAKMDSNIELVLHRLVDQLLSGACEFHSRLNLALIGFGFSHHSGAKQPAPACHRGATRANASERSFSLFAGWTVSRYTIALPLRALTLPALSDCTAKISSAMAYHARAFT